MSRRGLALMVALALVTTSCGLVARRSPTDLAEESQELRVDEAAGVVIDLARFFGDCTDSTLGVTDVSQATSECEVIQILTNKFNAENELGIAVERLGGSQFAAYYDTLNATYAGGSPPDVAVMHASHIPDYASRGLLVPLGGALEEGGVDVDDWTDPAREAVTFQDRIYGVPFDVHTNLWHLNMDVLAEAGLVDDSGDPVLPQSTDEFLAHARQVRERTGKQYFAIDANQFALSVMMFLTLLYQQGAELVDESTGEANLDSPEALEALRFMNTIFDEGFADPRQDYTAAQSAFLEGNAAVLHNGTWVVNQYAGEAPFAYRTAPFPTLFGQPATWANSHTWVLPVHKSPERYRESLQFVAFLSAHVGDWAIGTGHLPSQQGVLTGETFAAAPQRSNFAQRTVDRAELLPQVGTWQPIEDILKREVESTWLTGKSPQQALADAQRLINQLLEQNAVDLEAAAATDEP